MDVAEATSKRHERILGLMATLTAADPASCDRGGLAELVAASQQVRAWLDAFDASVAARAAHPGVHAGACMQTSTLSSASASAGAGGSVQVPARSRPA